MRARLVMIMVAVAASMVYTSFRALVPRPHTRGKESDSVANVTQLATVDRGALEPRVSILPEWLMAQVDAGLERALALGRPR